MKRNTQKQIMATLLLSLAALNGCSDGSDAIEIPAPLYEIAPETKNSTIQADVSADEISQVEQECRSIADLCNDLYTSAVKEPSLYMPNQLVLTQQSIDAIENRLMEHDYIVLDTDAKYPSFLQNSDGIYRFWDSVQNNKNDKQAYIWISPYGGFHYCSLENRDDGAFFLEAAAEWNEQNEIEITELYKRDVLDWDLSENGNFYYKLYEAHSPAFEDYTLLRLNAPDKALYDLSSAYVEPIGYQSNNLFSSEWSSQNYGNLCFNDVFEFLYRQQAGQLIDPLALQVKEHPFYYQIPADVFESAIMPYFNISMQQFREQCCYDADANTYPWLDIAYDNLSYFPLITPEVNAQRQNSDGTITLTVDAMCVGMKTDSLFRHELTIKPMEDGSFQYVKNHIITMSEEVPAYKPRLEMQRSEKNM